MKTVRIDARLGKIGSKLSYPLCGLHFKSATFEGGASHGGEKTYSIVDLREGGVQAVSSVLKAREGAPLYNGTTYATLMRDSVIIRRIDMAYVKSETGQWEPYEDPTGDRVLMFEKVAPGRFTPDFQLQQRLSPQGGLFSFSKYIFSTGSRLCAAMVLNPDPILNLRSVSSTDMAPPMTINLGPLIRAAWDRAGVREGLGVRWAPPATVICISNSHVVFTVTNVIGGRQDFVGVLSMERLVDDPAHPNDALVNWFALPQGYVIPTSSWQVSSRGEVFFPDEAGRQYLGRTKVYEAYFCASDGRFYALGDATRQALGTNAPIKMATFCAGYLTVITQDQEIRLFSLAKNNPYEQLGRFDTAERVPSGTTKRHYDAIHLVPAFDDAVGYPGLDLRTAKGTFIGEALGMPAQLSDAQQRPVVGRGGASYRSTYGPTSASGPTEVPEVIISSGIPHAELDIADLQYSSEETPLCDFCHANAGYLLCEQCQKRRYCSHECQQFDWRRRHSRECGK